MTGEDKGPLVTLAASRIEFSLRKAGSEKTMTLAFVWKGETETGILWCGELRVHWNAFNVTLPGLSSDTSWLSI